MATTNLSAYDANNVPNASDMCFVIIVSEWNQNITFGLRDGAIDAILKNGGSEENITVMYVPGSFELTFASKSVANALKEKGMDGNTAIIALGSVVRGGTPHFDYVCSGTTNGLAALNADKDIEVPIIFGLLTTDDMHQAEDRAGGKLGNKGVECAITAIKMLDFKQKVEEI